MSKHLHQWGAVLGGLGSSEQTDLPPASQSSFLTESAYLATLHVRLIQPLQGTLEDVTVAPFHP